MNYLTRRKLHFKHLGIIYSNLFQMSKFSLWIFSVSLAVSLLLIETPYTSFAASTGKSVKEGNALYKEQKFDQALEKYRDAFEKDGNSDVINFDMGTVLYKKNNFDESIVHFQKSLLTEDEKLKEKTHYNLGNVFYRTGIEKEENDLHATIIFLKQSLKEYEKALVLNKKNEDAIFNYEFVKKELERIEKKQQQRQQNNKDQKQDSDKADQQESQSDQNHQQGQPDKEKQNQQQKNQMTQKQESQDSKQAKKNQPQGEQEQQGMKEAPAQEMSREEAEMMLEGYKQNEEPRELLNFQRNKRSEQPVLKDW